MKHCITALMLLAFVAAASAQTYQRPIGKQKAVRAAATPPPVAEREFVRGAIPTAVRAGNPIQLLNPKAPARYGTAEQNVMIDPYTGKWRGIKLFEIFF